MKNINKLRNLIFTISEYYSELMKFYQEKYFINI